MEKDNKVTKSNRIIEARYRLSLLEQRFLLLMASYIQPDDTDFRYYRVKIKELFKVLGLENNKRAYQYLKEVVQGLQTKVLIIKKSIDGKDRDLRVSWVASSEYFDKEGIVEFEFSEKLKPYLLHLQSEFTTYQLKNVIKLKSVYSIRIYELLKQYEKLKKRVFEVDEIKRILGVEKKYELYGDFKKNVLKVAEKELPEKTDLAFTFKEIKLGRKVHKLEFHIMKNNLSEQEELPPVDLFEANLPKTQKPPVPGGLKAAVLKEAQKTGLTEKDAQALYEALIKHGDAADGDEAALFRYFTDKIRLFNEQDKHGKISNPAGFLIRAVENNYTNPQKSKARPPKKAESAQAGRIQELEALKDTMTREFYQQQDTICLDILAQHPGLLDELAELAKHSPFAARRYNKESSPDQNYKDPSVKALINAKIKERHPAYFEAIEKKFQASLAALEKQMFSAS